MKNIQKKVIMLLNTFIFAVILCGAVSATESNNTNISSQIMNVDVPFVENEGQINDTAKYYTKTFYGTGYVTNSSIVHQIENKKNNMTLVIKEEFLDSNGNVIEFHPKGEDPSNTVVSYFTGTNPDQWKTNLKTYNIIDLGYLYPGIQVKLRAHGDNIEKIFFVDPNADPNQIRIRITGADNLTLNPNGNLVISSADFGTVEMTKPIAFQKDKNIEAAYKINETTYQYTIGNYNKNKKLTIDPTLNYSTYIGGTSGDLGFGIAVDSNGNTYITGYTGSANFPTTPGAFQTIKSNNVDAFVSKLNPTGTALIYSTYLGGRSDDWGDSIAVDNNGNAYITGYTNSANFPVTSGAFQTRIGNRNDVFVSKLNPTGTALIYSTYIGGTSDDYGNSIAVDNNGNAYITGDTNSANFPVTSGAFQTRISGTDAFVSKLNPTGTALVYSTYLGGTYYDLGEGIVVDSSGNAFITGRTSSNNFPTTQGAFQTTLQGIFDAFVTKLNPKGEALIYSTYLGGTNLDRGDSIVVDSSGNAYITGLTRSDDFPTTLGAFQTTLQGNVDVFVSKLNPSGTALVYSTYLGGTSEDWGTSIAVDSNSNTYITGYTSSINFPVTYGAFQTTYGGGIYDGFVTKLNPTGTALAYGTYLGGTMDDYGNSIAVDSNGNAYITGYTGSPNFATTQGAFQTTLQGSFDAFVAKFLHKDQSKLTVNNATGNKGKSVTLKAKLTDYSGTPLNNKIVEFYIDNVKVGESSTKSNGIAVFNYNITQIGGKYNITAKFIEDTEYLASIGNGTLKVNQSSIYVNVTASKTNPTVGETIILTFKLGNNGPDPADDVVFTYVIPEGMEFVSIETESGYPQATYNPSNRTITWTLGTVPIQDPWIKLKLRVLNPGAFNINPTVTTSTYDPTLKNNIQQITINAVQAANAASNTIGMRETGIPINYLILSILAVISGFIVPKRK